MLPLNILWLIISIDIYSVSQTYILYDGNILHMVYDVNDYPLQTSELGTCVVASRLWCRVYVVLVVFNIKQCWQGL